MRPRCLTRCLSALFCALLPGLSSAHELWVEPQVWQLETGQDIVADLRNGENFKGSTLAWFPKNITRAEAVFGDDAVAYGGRLGDRPALVTPAAAEGLAILLHETTPSRITYKTWEKFAKFVAHKDLGISQAAHLAQGHPKEGFTESYTRHAKSLVNVGNGQGADREFGLETEFVALSNPYSVDFDQNMRVALFYNQEPRAGVQVEVFERAPDGMVKVSLTQTDAAGQAVVPVLPGHTYLFDAVVLRPGTQEGSIYDTLWAALTFHVP